MLATERSEAWSGVTVPRGELITLGPDLWLATDPDLCQLKGQPGKPSTGARVAASWEKKMNTPALVSGDSLAYRARLRPVPCVPPCLLSSRMTFGNWITVAGSFTPVV